jgi:hypothetical protein
MRLKRDSDQQCLETGVYHFDTCRSSHVSAKLPSKLIMTATFWWKQKDEKGVGR